MKWNQLLPYLGLCVQAQDDLWLRVGGWGPRPESLALRVVLSKALVKNSKCPEN